MPEEEGEWMKRERVAVGIDGGSTAAKAVRFDGKRILTSKVVVCSTGYFRRKIEHDHTITEISAARLGVGWFFDDTDVIIDLGGQDTKVIDLRHNALHMNDKCSAGTGAFLEQAAHYFGTDTRGLAALASRAKRKADINSTCSVFALSEIISRMERGHTKSEVAAGLLHAFARRIAELVPAAEKYVAVGGVALNSMMIRELSGLLGRKIRVPEQAQLINALGAARHALSQ
jgi:predicted CoA-substrate-specific enzyme activase